LRLSRQSRGVFSLYPRQVFDSFTNSLDSVRRSGTRLHARKSNEDTPSNSSVAQQEAESGQETNENADEQSETLGEVLRKRRAVSDTTAKDVVARGDKSVTSEADNEFSLDTINPYVIGRKSRAAFDDVWGKLSRLGSSSFVSSLDFYDDDNALEAPQAAYTTVLVIGATGRVGRIVLRKLLLRGYTVKVLARKEDMEFPKSVEVIKGDVGEMRAVNQAVQGADKVIYCAAARSSITADLSRVEHIGVSNVVKAMQDQYNRRAVGGGKSKSSRAKVTVADFGKAASRESWALEHVGMTGDSSSRRVFDRGQDKASVMATEDNNLRFTGAIYTRSGYAEMGSDVSGEEVLGGTDGLLIRMLGDGNVYTCTLSTKSGSEYSLRFTTSLGYNTVRLAFNAFRPSDPQDGPLDPADVNHMGFKFEPKRSAGATSGFKMELDWIKALSSGEETDLLLLSRSPNDIPGAASQEMRRQLQKRVDFKHKGETCLRNSGLGYTIIRPGPLVEEPGGYKALVFDQTTRELNSISCADVADICVKALHQPSARNKTFEVCHEYTAADGLEQYELIAHVPSKSSNYLDAALSNLQSMT